MSFINTLYDCNTKPKEYHISKWKIKCDSISDVSGRSFRFSCCTTSATPSEPKVGNNEKINVKMQNCSEWI